MQGPERRRREERIAVALERADLLTAALNKVIDEGGLSDARLAADQRDSSAPGCDLVEGGGQFLQVVIPFE